MVDRSWIWGKDMRYRQTTCKCTRKQQHCNECTHIFKNALSWPFGHSPHRRGDVWRAWIWVEHGAEAARQTSTQRPCTGRRQTARPVALDAATGPSVLTLLQFKYHLHINDVLQANLGRRGLSPPLVHKRTLFMVALCNRETTYIFIL